MQSGDWYFCSDQGEPCQIVSVQAVWGEDTCLVWMPRRDAVVRIPARGLQSIEDATLKVDQLSFIAAAARIVDALERTVASRREPAEGHGS